MRIIDPVTNSIGLGYDSSRDTIGIVFKTSEMLDDRPILGLIIPKFMLGYEFQDGDQPKEININIDKSKCINDDKDTYWDSTAVIKNYILVYPYLNQNQQMPKYTQGDKVIVTMIDNDIKTLAFLPYSINRLGQRATDKLSMAVPGNPQENTAMTEDNSYIIKLDSTEDQQKIILQTSNENGEMVKHTLEINSKDGIITITDNEDLSIVMDTQNDSITSKTSDTTIEQVGDKVNITCDTMTINADSKIYMKTDKLEIEADSIEETSSDTKIKADNYKQESTNGKWEVDSEKHEGMSFAVQANTFHSDCPVNGLNGATIFPAFQIGSIPNISAIPSPTNGMSGPQGMMSMQTSPSGVPLVKFPQLVAALGVIATSADIGAKSGAASAAFATFASGGNTLKIMAD